MFPDASIVISVVAYCERNALYKSGYASEPRYIPLVTVSACISRCAVEFSPFAALSGGNLLSMFSVMRTVTAKRLLAIQKRNTTTLCIVTDGMFLLVPSALVRRLSMALRAVCSGGMCSPVYMREVPGRAYSTGEIDARDVCPPFYGARRAAT